ncbi:MAG: hypothetical protein RL417_2073 [Pseudomonadota bacterium]|jgi:hypothetical protein
MQIGGGRQVEALGKGSKRMDRLFILFSLAVLCSGATASWAAPRDWREYRTIELESYQELLNEQHALTASGAACESGLTEVVGITGAFPESEKGLQAGMVSKNAYTVAVPGDEGCPLDTTAFKKLISPASICLEAQRTLRTDDVPSGKSRCLQTHSVARVCCDF